jgi:hypothetical protein
MTVPRLHSPDMWAYLRRFAPLRAFFDLRRYLGSRGKHEIIFLFAALAVCVLIIAMFLVDYSPKAIYREPDIIYVQSWPANRTDAEIVAQQKIDQAKKDKEDAQRAKDEAELRAQYKRASDTLNKFGI